MPTIRKFGADVSTHGDLSSAIEQTGFGSTQQSLSPDTKRAADAFAEMIVSSLPSVSPDVQLSLFPTFSVLESNVQTVSGNGQGATLSLAVADRLRKQGRRNASLFILDAIGEGCQALQAKT